MKVHRREFAAQSLPPKVLHRKFAAQSLLPKVLHRKFTDENLPPRHIKKGFCCGRGNFLCDFVTCTQMGLGIIIRMLGIENEDRNRKCRL